VRIGVPCEIKDSERRVALTPAGARELVRCGHEVLVQREAGRGSGHGDAEYEAAGAAIAADADSTWWGADLVLKVKEPLAEEYAHFRPDLQLFCYLHLASDEALTTALVESGCTAIAYETVRSAAGGLALLAPMSRIAGCMAAQVAACELYAPRGGNGMLLGGAPGVRPANAVVIGAGVAGYHAARLLAALGGAVTVLDIDLDRLGRVHDDTGGVIATLPSNATTLAEAVAGADVVVGATLSPGARAPTLLPRATVEGMPPRSVFVDISIDQGGCAETSRVTTHRDPTYVEAGVLHYCVGNMPAAVPRVSTPALANATLGYVLKVATVGLGVAARQDPGFAEGVTVVAGHVTHAAVARAHGREAVDVLDLV
jgi:alanine dehydrogenase